MKDFKYPQRLDFYGGLLTDYQREICELYYLYDLSLAEIAEQKEVSRQCVSETLKKSREALDGYEEKLRFVQKTNAYTKARETAFRLAEAAQEFAKDHPEAEELARLAFEVLHASGTED